MGQRLDLQARLELLAPNVYFQPPRNVQMAYPCIVYQRDYAKSEFADNTMYRFSMRYQVTVIDSNPDSDIPKKVAGLPTSTFSRHYAANNLHHDVYTLFF